MLNPPGPSTSENSGISAQIAESQGSPSHLRVEITVLRARDVPIIKNRFGKKRRFFVTVASQTTTKKTSSVQTMGPTVEWNEIVDAFYVQSSSRLVLSLYAARFAGRDILIGTHEMTPLESQSDVPFVLINTDRQGGQSMQPVTLYLTVGVSLHTTSQLGKQVLVGAGEATRPSAAQDSMKSTRLTISAASETLPYPKDHFPGETTTSMSPVADDSAGMSLAKNALRNADEAMTTINLSDTWGGALERINWVMETVSPVAGLHPYAKMAYGLLSVIPKILLEQFQRDDNIRKLLVAMHDAFDFTNQEHVFKAIGRESKQAQILTLMLQHVCNCCDFIQSYAKDSQFWKKRMLMNIGGQTNKQIEDFRTALLKLRNAFLDHSTITTEITVLQILDDLGIVSANVGSILSHFDGMATRLKWVSSQVSDAELDARIREIPYGAGSRFTPEKSCLPGTRMAFLDFIVDWVDNPDSERSLLLFGQAGMGKSSIAHEIARRYDKMHRLTSSFIFLREEQSKHKAYYLFTTLARDLSDRYPSFRAALGEVVKYNSSLRVGTRDYSTLFQSLILDPLKDLRIVGPILVVIDALDESGDVSSGNGLHKFLAKNLSRLPSNFRVLITSRPEDGIESAFIGAPSVRIKYMDDPGLAARTHDDILTFLQTTLLSEELNTYCAALATKAEGLFQWAAVACGYILDPPDSFDFNRIRCIEHLLKPTTDPHRPDPLDELYDEVLTGYFKYQGARYLFCSVVGHLIAAFEPLSIRSLITLRQHASIGDNSNPDSVGRMLRRLSSLLSNVNSSDKNLPIIPLHTSFRDFLTNKEKSGDFYIDLGLSHRRLVHSCLDLVLHDLKFNICDLESSYLANSDVHDLKSRIAEHISPALLYACHYWGDHLKHSASEKDLFDKLQAFFDKNFLFWLEVLSLTSSVRLALPALLTLDMWLVSGKDVFQVEIEAFQAFINDASAFVRYFGIAMAKSAPHVYLSALPFAPTCSLVSAHYSHLFP